MSALTLRIIASVCMLLDHVGIFCGIEPLRWIGRLAFPLYVFLMVNGFLHTKSRLRYAARFGLFALISQIPFFLLSYHAHIDLQNMYRVIVNHPSLVFSKWNVMLTLLMALLVIWSTEALWRHKFTKWLCVVPALAAWLVYYCGYLRSDYGIKGTLLALVFWLFCGEKPWQRICTTLGTAGVLMYDVFFKYAYHFVKGYWDISQPSYWQTAQLFGLVALTLIYLYNGKPGKLPENRIARKSVQLGFYAFYPVHMLVLWLIF